jgi:hypothetical protein
MAAFVRLRRFVQEDNNDDRVRPGSNDALESRCYHAWFCRCYGRVSNMRCAPGGRAESVRHACQCRLYDKHSQIEVTPQ